MKDKLAAIFRNAQSSEQAIAELKTSGVSEENIKRHAFAANEERDEAGGGSGAGAASGQGLNSIVTAFAGYGFAKETAEELRGNLSDGSVLVVVAHEEKTALITNVLERNGGKLVGL